MTGFCCCAQAFIVSNLVAPTWPITVANLMLIIQVIGCYQVRAYDRIIRVVATSSIVQHRPSHHG